MAVTFRQLKHFLVLSQELHFSRAAKRLNMSQPPLSASLKQLEATLGFKLMDRNNRTVRLTSAGAVFADHAARILGQLESACALAEQQAKGAAGKLSLSFVPSMLFRNLPHTIHQFEETYPSVELELHEMNTTRQIEAILQGKAEVGFIHAVLESPELCSYKLQTERLMCCVPRKHHLASRSRISISEMTGEKVLVFSREFAEYYHDRIVGLLRAEGVEPYTPYKVQHWFTIVALVAQGMGISLVPYSLSRSTIADLVYIEIEEANAEHEVHMIWSRKKSSNLSDKFVRYVQLHGLG